MTGHNCRAARTTSINHSQPAIGVGQYVVGVCLASVSSAFNQGLVQTLFNKILGPKPQVRILLKNN